MKLRHRCGVETGKSAVHKKSRNSEISLSSVDVPNVQLVDSPVERLGQKANHLARVTVANAKLLAATNQKSQEMMIMRRNCLSCWLVAVAIAAMWMVTVNGKVAHAAPAESYGPCNYNLPSCQQPNENCSAFLRGDTDTQYDVCCSSNCQSSGVDTHGYYCSYTVLDSAPTGSTCPSIVPVVFVVENTIWTDISEPQCCVYQVKAPTPESKPHLQLARAFSKTGSMR